MIHPSPTTPISPTLARGVLAELHAATATKPAIAVIEFPNSNYQLHLVPTSQIATPVGKRIVGTIRVQARRLDIVDTGGNFVEPVIGRPRRVQGRVVEVDETSNTVIVDAGMVIHLSLTDPRQRARQFPKGELVSCDVFDGATFSPQI